MKKPLFFSQKFEENGTYHYEVTSLNAFVMKGDPSTTRNPQYTQIRKYDGDSIVLDIESDDPLSFTTG